MSLLISCSKVYELLGNVQNILKTDGSVRRVIPIDTGKNKSYYVGETVRAFNGDILHLCHAGSTHYQSNDIKILAYRSVDDGLSWKAEGILAEDPTHQLRNPVATVTANGRIIMSYGRLQNPGEGWDSEQYIKYSDDHGHSWQGPVTRSSLGLPGSIASYVLNPVDSSLICACRDLSTGYQYHVYRSTMAENGLSWTKISDNITPESNSPAEAFLEYLGPRLFCCVRLEAGTNKVGILYSDNDGITWSNTSYHPELQQLAGWNRIFRVPGGLIWMFREYHERHGQINYYYSRDGHFWFRAGELLRLPTSFDSGYWDVVDRMDGRILATFPVEHDPFGDRTQTVENSLSGVYATILNVDPTAIRGKASSIILSKNSIAPEEWTTLDDCMPVSLEEGITNLTVTVEGTYNADATSGLAVRVLSSYDGVNWDTQDLDTWDVDFGPGLTIRQTRSYPNIAAHTLKVAVGNLDNIQAVENVKAVCSLSR